MEEKTTLDIIVNPRSSRREIIVEEGSTIRVYLHSPPADGRANAECVSLFSKYLGIAKSKIIIDKGKKGRRKRILIDGLSQEEIFSFLRAKSR